MDAGFERQLKKGVLEMLVLALVCEQPTYGYELMAQIDRRSSGLLRLREGTLYPILYRLEDAGAIRAEWHTQAGRTAPKKYYHATQAGRDLLDAHRRTWRSLAACVDDFFDLQNNISKEEPAQ